MKRLLLAMLVLGGAAACSDEETSLGSGSALTSTPCDRCDPNQYPKIICQGGAKAPCLVRKDGTCGWDNKCPNVFGGTGGTGAGGTGGTTGESCGDKVCGEGQYCCNASCGICAPKGAACILSTCGGADAGRSLRFYDTCGDIVCNQFRRDNTVPLCSTQKNGDSCGTEGERCQIDNDTCNTHLICAASDPTISSGVACPISRRETKRDIHYLGADELAGYRKQLLGMKLATWRYKHDPSKERLGFIIDDHPTSPAVDGARDIVDLYGYTSLAVATVQSQAREIEALKLKLDTIEAKLAKSNKSRAR